MDEQLWEEYLKTRSDAARNAILETHWSWVRARTEVILLRRRRFIPVEPVLSHIADRLLVRYIPNFDPSRATFRKYLSSLLYRLIADYLQDGQRRHRHGRVAMIEEERSRLSHLLGHRATDSQVAESICTTEAKLTRAFTEQIAQLAFSPAISSQDRFERLIESLPPRHKGLLRLFYLHGYTAKEIAARAHVSTQAIYRRLDRARELLRHQVVFSGPSG